MLHVMHDEFPDNVIAVNAIGVVSNKDYEEILLPAIKNRLQQYEKVSLLYVFGFEFKDFDVDPLWGDTLLEAGYLSKVEKLTVVSNLKWIETGVKLFNIFIPFPVRFYNEQKILEAKAWLTEA